MSIIEDVISDPDRVSKAELRGYLERREVLRINDFPGVGGDEDGGATAHDDTVGIQLAITTAAGRPLIAEAGNYKITSPLTHSLNSLTTNPGLVLIGRGAEQTIFHSYVANDYAIKVDPGGVAFDGRQQKDTHLARFGVRARTTTNGSGIYLHDQTAFTVEYLRLWNHHGRGMMIDCQRGDPDSSSGATIRHNNFDACFVWGLDGNCTAGHNEIGNFTLFNNTFRGCGVDDGGLSTPTSGGCRLKGQVWVFVGGNTAINCVNCGILIYGGAGAPATIVNVGTNFENNKGRPLVIQGGYNMLFLGTRMVSTVPGFEAVKMVDVSGAQKIRFQSTTMRVAAAQTPVVAFSFASDSLDCSVDDTTWETFGAAGQDRFDMTGIGARVIDDGVQFIGYVPSTGGSGLTRGDLYMKGTFHLRTGAGVGLDILKLNASTNLEIGSTAVRSLFNGYTHFRLITTAQLPAVSTAMDKALLIEDAGGGVYNLVWYSGTKRFRFAGTEF
jgi:hypothetical protein